MSVFRDLMYLEHMLESIDKIQSYTQKMDENSFQNSSLIQDAVIRQFEILGEASKRISEALKQNHADIPWKDISGMRDILIHDYIHVQIDVVWETIRSNLPPLKEKISRIIEDYA